MPKKLLIAEDDEDNRDLMIFMVERSGLDVTLFLAENGDEAVTLTRREKPDLILMDMQMPVMDGFTAVKLIKSDPALQQIPIIAFTAQARAEDRDITRSIGCIAHYTKPMDPEELIGVIKRYGGL
jgi:CheY-like chemotaxis protein